MLEFLQKLKRLVLIQKLETKHKKEGPVLLDKIAVKTKNISAQKNSSRKYELRRPSQMQAAQKLVCIQKWTPRIPGTTNEIRYPDILTFAGRQLTPQQFNTLRQQFYKRYGKSL